MTLSDALRQELKKALATPLPHGDQYGGWSGPLELDHQQLLYDALAPLLARLEDKAGIIGDLRVEILQLKAEIKDLNAYLDRIGG